MMEKVEKFLSDYTKYTKGSFVTRKTLFNIFKKVTNTKIRAKDFKAYCDEHLSVKNNFRAADGNNKTKKIKMAYEIEVKLDNEWSQEYMIQPKEGKKKHFEGYVYDIILTDKTNTCFLINEDGEKFEFHCIGTDDKFECLEDMKKCFLKKSSIDYYEKVVDDKTFRNIFDVKRIKVLSDKDKKILVMINRWAYEKYSFLGRSLFGQFIDVEELTTEEKAELNAA